MSASSRSNLIQLGNIKISVNDEQLEAKEAHAPLTTQLSQSVQEKIVQEKPTISVPTTPAHIQTTPKLQSSERTVVTQTEKVSSSAVTTSSPTENSKKNDLPPSVGRPSLRPSPSLQQKEVAQPDQPNQPAQSTSSRRSHVASKSLVSRMQKLLAKNNPEGEQVAEVDQKLNDVKAYPADHKFLLVLFTTEEGELKQSSLNTLYMFHIFQLHFNCRCIVYTTTPEIIDKCNELDIATSDSKKNPYNLPYIGDLYKKSKELFKSYFYGFINADILISTDMFGVLEYMKTVKERDYPNRLIEICHNSYNAYPPRFSNVLTRATYDKTFGELVGQHKGQRGVSSVDMFILSDDFDNIEFKPIVVARSRIDTYMMYMVVDSKGVLFDSADAAKTIHQGLDRYTKRAKKTAAEDYNWNKNLMEKLFADLNLASGNIRKTSDGFKIERRENIVMKKDK